MFCCSIFLILANSIIDLWVLKFAHKKIGIFIESKNEQLLFCMAPTFKLETADYCLKTRNYVVRGLSVI
jgi:hypothetical protein